MNTIRRRPSAFAGLLLSAGAALAAAGCNHGSGLVQRHMESDMHAGARSRWNDMRGSMKLQIAEQHLRAGRLDEAERILNDVFSIAPQHPDVLKLAARLYLEQGRLGHAREAIERALAQPGSGDEIEHLAGIIFHRSGDLERALRHYRAAASASPGSLAHLLAAAELLVSLDRPGEALQLIQPRRGDHEESAELAILAARIYRSMNLRAPAADECRRALRAQDAGRQQLCDIGEMLLWAGADEEAVAILRPLFDECHRRHTSSFGSAQAACEFPQSLAQSMAAAYLSMGRWRDATAVLKPLMDGDAAEPGVWLLYCRASISGGDPSAARRALDEFHRRAAPTAETLLLEAYATQRLGEHEDACRLAVRALKHDDSLVAAWWIIGRSARALGRHEQAKEAFAHALTIDPDSQETRAMLEDVLDDMAADATKERTR